MSFINLPPKPSATVEAITGIGYTLKAAIADLVDNSITAKAKNIWIDFHWKGRESFVSITDDGSGMTYDQLSEAMRPGGKNPRDERDSSDLGRFSLGLKSASWSQSRVLKVWTKTDKGQLSSMSWDLDYVLSVDEWIVKNDIELVDACDRLIKLKNGTIVLWESLSGDIIYSGMNRAGADHFNMQIKEVHSYLGMIFHRFITGSVKTNKNRGPIRIYINNVPILPWDPFEGGDEISPGSEPPEYLNVANQDVCLTGYVMPHPDTMSEADRNFVGGPEGWLMQQGFYVYRSDRLIVAGDWLGLGEPRKFLKDKQYQLARLSIEIPNSIDKEWSLDIKKSSATPPPMLRPRFNACAEKIREKARMAYVARGKYGRKPQRRTTVITQVWSRSDRENLLAYKLNQKHPLVTEFMTMLGDSNLKNEFVSIIRLIEESLPIRQIWLDSHESNDVDIHPYENMSTALREDMHKTFKALCVTMPANAAIDALKMIEPFNRYLDEVESLGRDYE